MAVSKLAPALTSAFDVDVFVLAVAGGEGGDHCSSKRSARKSLSSRGGYGVGIRKSECSTRTVRLGVSKIIKNDPLAYSYNSILIGWNVSHTIEWTTVFDPLR